MVLYFVLSDYFNYLLSSYKHHLLEHSDGSPHWTNCGAFVSTVCLCCFNKGQIRSLQICFHHQVPQTRDMIVIKYLDHNCIIDVKKYMFVCRLTWPKQYGCIIYKDQFSSGKALIDSTCAFSSSEPSYLQSRCVQDFYVQTL